MTVLGLLRRDRALLGVLIYWPGAVILGAAAADIAAERSAAGGMAPLEGWPAFALGVVFAGLASVNYLSAGGAAVATRFQMALPVSARTLWLARMAALLIPVPGAMVAGAVAFGIAGSEPPALTRLGLGANLWALTVFIPSLYHSGGVTLAGRGMRAALFLPLVVAAVAATVLLGPNTLRPAAILVTASVVLLAATWVRLPAAFELAEAGVEGAPGRRSHDRVPALGSALWRALAPPRWIGRDQYTLLILLGAAVNVLLLMRSPLVGLVTPVILMTAWFIRTLNGASNLDHLPISRSRFLHHGLLPGLGGLAAVILIAVAWTDTVSFGDLAGSPVAAAAALLFVGTWGLSMASVLEAVAPPPATGRGRWWRYARRFTPWGWLVLLGTTGGVHLRFPDDPSVVVSLARILPDSGPGVWALALALLALSYGGLRTLLNRVEICTLGRGLV